MLEFFASCLVGVEDALAKELQSLSILRVRPLKGGVAFFCAPELAMKACLWSRLASRIVLILQRGNGSSAEALYETAAAMAWEEIFAPNTSFSVKASGTNAALRNSRFTALKVKDAIADRLRANRDETKTNTAREINPPLDLRASVDVRIRDQKVTIGLDFSGEALNRRPYFLADEGEDAPYRVSQASAALAMALNAAGLGGESVPSPSFAFFDPYCGDGFLLMEAASLAARRAPSLGRARWGFMAWSGFDAASWAAIYEEAESTFAQTLEVLGGHREGEGPSIPDGAKALFVGQGMRLPSIKIHRQIESKTLAKLRHPSRSSKLKDYLED